MSEASQQAAAQDATVAVAWWAVIADSRGDFDDHRQQQQANAWWAYLNYDAYRYTWPGDAWKHRGWAADGGWWTGPWGRSGAAGWSRDNQDRSWSSWAGDQSAGESNSRATAPEDEGRTQRRASVQSGTQSTEAASMDDHDHDGLDDRDPKDSDVSSASGKKETPKTGKDYVPEYNGSTPMREYERRVKMFEASTGIDDSHRGQKLMERLSGAGWLATESLDLRDLKHPKGVERLLTHTHTNTYGRSSSRSSTSASSPRSPMSTEFPKDSGPRVHNL